MHDELNKTFDRNFIYNTAPKCPFCGGIMLPLEYIADGCPGVIKTSAAWLYDDIPGELKACNQCGIVKFYFDGES